VTATATTGREARIHGSALADTLVVTWRNL